MVNVAVTPLTNHVVNFVKVTEGYETTNNVVAEAAKTLMKEKAFVDAIKQLKKQEYEYLNRAQSSILVKDETFAMIEKIQRIYGISSKNDVVTLLLFVHYNDFLTTSAKKKRG